MKRPRSESLMISVLSALAMLGWRCAGEHEAQPANVAAAPVALVVRAQAVSTGDWTVTIPVSGSLRSQSVVEVKPEVGGRLTATYPEEGDFVKLGSLLAELDPSNYRLAVGQAQAALSVAQAGLGRAQVMEDHARRERERADNLLRTGGITEKDHQAAVTGVRDADAQVRLAEAQVEQARASLAVAEKALADCRITSPADGHVQRKYFDRGSLMGPGTPLYTIVDNGRLELECDVPSQRLSELKPGQRVEFSTPAFGDRSFAGTVGALNPAVESDSRSIRVIARITNPGGELRSGMYARGSILTRTAKDVLIVPRSALLVEDRDLQSGNLFVVEENRARRRQVKVGGIQRDLVWVQEGLRRGESVIVEIGPDLQDGSAVQVAAERPGTGS